VTRPQPVDQPTDRSGGERVDSLARARHAVAATAGRTEDSPRGLWAWLWDARDAETERREQLIRWHERDRAARAQGTYLTCGPGMP
jgi:hypothetical protein